MFATFPTSGDRQAVDRKTMSDQVIRVGVTGTGYPEQRNIIGLPFRNVHIGRHRDPIQWVDLLYFKLTGKFNTWTHAVHNDLGLSRFDVHHFFNKVSYSSKPWVSTFESFIPRHGHPSWGMVATMTRSSCLQLIAMSDRAKRTAASRLERFPNLRDDIMERVMVVHPPQATILNSVADKTLLGDRIRLILVGHLFFLKGGLEVLRVVDRLLDRGAPLHLTIVSTLQTGDYVTHSGTREMEAAMRIIARHPHSITHHKTLPNAQVLELFRTSDVSLLPSYHDSYGYSVLESQACGCPAITTDVAALPEINSDAQGWLLRMPTNEVGDGPWRQSEGRATMSRLIEEQLEATLEAILRTPEQIRAKGANALQRIRDEHSPETRAALVEAIYSKVRGRS